MPEYHHLIDEYYLLVQILLLRKIKTGISFESKKCCTGILSESPFIKSKNFLIIDIFINKDLPIRKIAKISTKFLICLMGKFPYNCILLLDWSVKYVFDGLFLINANWCCVIFLLKSTQSSERCNVHLLKSYQWLELKLNIVVCFEPSRLLLVSSLVGIFLWKVK